MTGANIDDRYINVSRQQQLLTPAVNPIPQRPLVKMARHRYHIHSSQVKATLLYRTNIMVDRDTIQKQCLRDPTGNGSASARLRIVIINRCIEQIDMKVVNVLWMLRALIILSVNPNRHRVLKQQRGTTIQET